MKKMLKFIVFIFVLCASFIFVSNNTNVKAFAVDDTRDKGSIVIQNGASYTMCGGSLSGQEATYGSAFYVCEGGLLELNGGSISSNTSEYWVIYAETGAKIKITGDFSFSGNSSEYINVSYNNIDLPMYLEPGAILEIADGVNISSVNNTSGFTLYFIIEDNYNNPKRIIPQKISKYQTLNDCELPFSLDDCAGYFLDENYTEVLSFDTELYSLTSVNYLNVYTIEATSFGCLADEYHVENNEIVVDTYYLNSYNTNITENEIIAIPATYQGVPITKIPEGFFDEFTNLKRFVVGQNIQEVHSRNFKNSLIEELNIPDNVTFFSPYAFEGQRSLQQINVGSGNENYSDFDCNGVFSANGRSLFVGCLNTDLPEGLLYVESNAFSGSDIESIILPSTLQTIGTNAFENCVKLKSINLPNTVENIDVYGFSGCTSLKSINIPQNIKMISDSAFINCAALEIVYIPTIENLNSIGDDIFNGCNFESLTFITEIVSIESANSISESVTALFSYITSIVDESNIYYGYDLEFINGNSSVNIKLNTYIGNDSDVDMPEGINVIGENAFADNLVIESISIPYSVTNIDTVVIYNCTNLKYIYVPETLDVSDVFYIGCPSVEIIIRNETQTTFKSSARLVRLKDNIVVTQCPIIYFCKRLFVDNL